ncbi:alpha/beta-hydrolase [Colletotrichum somersetense]|nr:alpha/beta-hydrolase [Colletotrichum somersetense]
MPALWERLPPSAARQPQGKHAFPTDKTSKFAVNGTSIPNVGFDAGESYAGLLPIVAGDGDGEIPGSSRYGDYVPECDVLALVTATERAADPCFSVFNVLRTCPLPFDPLGFSENTWDHPGPKPVYFDRPDVKAAIHAPPDGEWRFCSRRPVFVDDVDGSLAPGPGSLLVIPGVVERTGNVVVGHGLRDLMVQSADTLMAIQNMTWGGALGFQSRPGSTLRVPYDHGYGGGELGVWHSERGLTYFETPTAGHFLGRDAPFVSFRALDVLIGRARDFGSDAPFTTDLEERRAALSEEL